jgi:hypothetical protein
MTATISARLTWTAYGSSIGAFTETHVFRITLDGPPDKPVSLAGYRRAEVSRRWDGHRRAPSIRPSATRCARPNDGCCIPHYTNRDLGARLGRCDVVHMPWRRSYDLQRNTPNRTVDPKLRQGAEEVAHGRSPFCLAVHLFGATEQLKPSTNSAAHAALDLSMHDLIIAAYQSSRSLRETRLPLSAST